MSANVISHQAPHRKLAQPWTAHRVAVLVVTLAAIAAASWLASSLNRPAPAPAPAALPQASTSLQPAVLPQAATAPDAIMQQPASAPRRNVRAAAARTGIPLDVGNRSNAPGYEILTAAELADISQARE